jgi:hypothetical protein
MEHSLPNDDDGDALRRVIETGSDISKPMFVDFQIAVPTEESALELAGDARKLGYHAEISNSPECKLPWTCECSTRMLATYEALIAVQKELAQLAAPYGGFPDRWGTFGNGPSGQPSVV